MKIKFLDLKAFDETFKVSELEIVEAQFYFISSDGEEVLLTNKTWDTASRFPIKHSTPYDASHPEHTRAAATVIIRDGKHPAFLLLGSGQDNGANWALKINLKSRLTEEIDLTVFYNRVKESGITSLEIDSATILNDKIVLCSKSSDDEPGGVLIVTNADFWKKQSTADISVSRLQWDKQTERVVMISAIFYSYQNDWLIVAGNSNPSTGENASGLEREIFMGVVENAYRKIDRKRIKVNEFFNLALEDEIFRNQTIKSIAIDGDKEKKLKLHMIGADVDGGNNLIKLRLKES